MKEDVYRIDYLLGVTEEVLRQINLLINFWESEYKETFIKATGISCSENARCWAFNQLINILDIIRVTKIGKPAGLEGSNSTAIESLEAYRSESYIELIQSSLEEVQNAYANSTVNFSKIVDEIADSSEASITINISFNTSKRLTNVIYLKYTHFNSTCAFLSASSTTSPNLSGYFSLSHPINPSGK